MIVWGRGRGRAGNGASTPRLRSAPPEMRPAPSSWFDQRAFFSTESLSIGKLWILTCAGWPGLVATAVTLA